ncbi:hypothetical protein PROVRETT_09465 [Providencia rettgeri DSM 1131]|nr:hypothetical protein PROVRETT_09465 [Providencia rettgeri DSM 1131]
MRNLNDESPERVSQTVHGEFVFTGVGMLMGTVVLIRLSRLVHAF